MLTFRNNNFVKYNNAKINTYLKKAEFANLFIYIFFSDFVNIFSFIVFFYMGFLL